MERSSSIIFFFRDEELGWMDDGTDGWKGPLSSSSSSGMRNFDGWMMGRMDGKVLFHHLLLPG
jgi:hypothetical protein